MKKWLSVLLALLVLAGALGGYAAPVSANSFDWPISATKGETFTESEEFQGSNIEIEHSENVPSWLNMKIQGSYKDTLVLTGIPTQAGTFKCKLYVSEEYSGNRYDNIVSVVITVKDKVNYPYYYGIYINTEPKKTTYEVGDKLDTSGMVVHANRQRSATQADYYVLSSNYITCSPTTLTKAGTQKITVSASLAGKSGLETFTTTFKVTVTEKKVPPVITKSPTKEKVDEGGSCKFIAKADNYDKITWMISSDTKGKNEMTVSQAKQKYSPLNASGTSKETLKLSDIPYSLNGWYVYAVFENQYGKSVTDKAKLTVIEAEATPEPAVTTPEPAKEKEPEAEVTPNLTPEPAPDPVSEPEAPAHDHAFSATWSSDENTHYHACECGERADAAEHNFLWTTLTKPSGKNTGKEIGVCSVCGYALKRDIPAASKGSGMNLLVIILIVLIALLLAAFGLIAFLLISKKKEEQRRAAARRARRRAEQAEENSIEEIKNETENGKDISDYDYPDED